MKATIKMTIWQTWVIMLKCLNCWHKMKPAPITHNTSSSISGTTSKYCLTMTMSKYPSIEYVLLSDGGEPLCYPMELEDAHEDK